MHVGTAVGCGVVGLLVGPPAVGIAFAVPAGGPLAVPDRWWLGRSVPLRIIGLVSLASGLVAAALGARLGWALVLPAFLYAAVSGIALSIVDIRHRRLPHAINGPVYAVSAVAIGADATHTHNLAPASRALLASALVSIAFLGLAMALPGQLGLGDVVLAGWIAMTLAWLAWSRLVFGLVAGLMLQSAIFAALLILGRKRHGDDLPLGPALLAGWLVGVVWVG